MRSRKRGAWRWLLTKEWRELVASRSFWVLLAVMGPLVGVSFINAVRTYADLSGLNGTVAGVGEAFSPLIGVWAPTFSACELAAAFLLPFVAIRLVSGDRQSGALKLELQHSIAPLTRVAIKAVILLVGWTIASAPALMALVLWRSYGGSIYAPEIVALITGHMLNAGLTVGLAAATASITEHPSTAAILTLTVTVGTWILNFIAAVQGGLWERAAAFTPTAMVSDFQHGLVRLDVLIAAVTLAGLGVAVAAIWMRLGVHIERRAYESIAVTALAAAVLVAATLATPSWDLSENRANSFSRADETALKQLHERLRIDVHLAPEDPRRVDLERHALSKLRRVLPDIEITYTAATKTGMFEQTAAQYGEIWYELHGRRTMSRVTSAEGVLETIFDLSGISPPPQLEADVFRGHPLAAPPRGAATIFYGVWPAIVVATAFFARRQ